MNKDYQVGAILRNTVGQFTKIISIRKGIYGLSGWGAKRTAEESTVAHTFVNIYGLTYGNVKVESKSKVKANAPAKTGDKEPTNDTDTIDLSKANGTVLKAYAKDNGIDITGAKNVAEIRELVIAASQKAAEETIEGGDDDQDAEDDTAEYTALEDFEYDGVDYEAGAILVLTESDANDFEEGLIEKVEIEDAE